jgi:arginine deiminase
MQNHCGIHVYSEIGKLRTVLLHRPGKEIENLTPDLMERLLFDDIPYLEVARQEHDAFAAIFRQAGVEVLYVEELIAEIFQVAEIKEAFLDAFVAEADIRTKELEKIVKHYFMQITCEKELADKLIEGLRREALGDYTKVTLADRIDSSYPFVVDPMPNLYFTRDPFSSMGSGISLNHMKTVTRNRETLFASFIFKHHPRFKDIDVPRWYNRDDAFSIEGGDQLVLSEKVLAIGVSERTEASAIDLFAKRLFENEDNFDVILAFDIPKKRAFMHLDTVFTMVDYDKFTIHPEIEGPLTVYSIRRGKEKGSITIEKETMILEDILKKYLELESVTLIRCGGGNLIDAGREQWNDGSNTLALAPGEVIVYSRNHVTNKLLESHGIKLYVMPSSELSRGRGGPRCMSMPLFRDRL